MALYARIDKNTVAEIIEAPLDLSDPKIAVGLTWLDVTTTTPQPAINWTWDGTDFHAPIAAVLTFAQAKTLLDNMLAFKEGAGVTFTVSGTAFVFATDPTSQVKALAANSMCVQNLWVDGTLWLSATGQAVPMTSAQAQALTLSMLAYIKACEAVYAALLVDVAADTGTDLSKGWPSQTVGGA